MKRLRGVEILSINGFRPENSVRAIKYSTQNIEFDKMTIISAIRPDNITDEMNFIEIPSLTTRGEYSKFCLGELYQYIESEHVLMIHDDGFVINPDKWEDEFLKYDYVGSPWPEAGADGNHIVGNGGFCLRSKKLVGLCAELGWNGYDHEDWQICIKDREFFEKNGCVFAPWEVGARFSIEKPLPNIKTDLEQTFGFHGRRTRQHSEKIHLLDGIE